MAIVGRKILDNVEILEVDSNPQFSGATAIIGSIALATDTGELYYKVGNTDFSWAAVKSDVADVQEFEDFNFVTLGSGTNKYSVIAAVANGGASTIEGAVTDPTYTGLGQVSTGTSNNATGRAALDFFNSNNRIRLGGFQLSFEMRVRIPVLSGTPAFDVEAGLVDTNAAGDPTNGIFFYYINSINGGAWRCITRSASTATNVDSTVTVVAGQWYKLRAVINSAGNQVQFYIDGELIGTSTTNIPATTIGMRPMLQIEKTTSTNTARTAQIDYVLWRLSR